MMNNVGQYLNHGISPESFRAGMTRNEEKFSEYYDGFHLDAHSLDAISKLQLSSQLKCLIIAADWCGDVVRNIPVVVQLMQHFKIPTEIFIMEENLSFIDSFLTFGGRSIPVVLFTDESGDVLGQWGPRPQHVQEVMAEFKETHTDKNHPDYDSDMQATKSEMMIRYGDDMAYQSTIVDELVSVLHDIHKK